MERVNRILNHPRYREYVSRTENLEKDRIYCRHNMAHFLDVARLAEIMNLRENLGIGEELIYGAALLHDIGRFLEYENGEPHEAASARLAPEILKDCGYTDYEQSIILAAIASHRNKEIAGESSLAGIVYRADKMSRSCFSCPAEKSCSWSVQKKNMELKF